MVERNSHIVSEGPLTTLKLLNSGHIPFVIVGGAAIALHGIPRSTLDIDIIVPAHSDIVHRLFSIVEEAGLISRHRNIFSLMKKPNLLVGQWITFEAPEYKELLDVLFEEPEIFDRLLNRSVKRKEKQHTFYIASLDDLEAMKRMIGRPIDLADIALIQEKRNLMKQRGKKSSAK